MSRDMTKPTKWLCTQRRLGSAWASTQADPSCCWAQMPFCWFCHVAAQMFFLIFSIFLMKLLRMLKFVKTTDEFPSHANCGLDISPIDTSDSDYKLACEPVTWVSKTKTLLALNRTNGLLEISSHS